MNLYVPTTDMTTTDSTEYTLAPKINSRDPTDNAATNTIESEKLIFRKSDSTLSRMMLEVLCSPSDVADTNETMHRR